MSGNSPGGPDWPSKTGPSLRTPKITRNTVNLLSHRHEKNRNSSPYSTSSPRPSAKRLRNPACPKRNSPATAPLKTANRKLETSSPSPPAYICTSNSTTISSTPTAKKAKPPARKCNPTPLEMPELLKCVIAVGTAVTGGPPRRSVREELPHTALALSRARKH
jgi:hypothetical protein